MNNTTIHFTNYCDENTNGLLAKAHKQLLSADRLNDRPSCRFDNQMPLNVEQFKRQQAAQFCEDLGKKLSLSRYCICTSIQYMHWFYMVHSFTKKEVHVVVPAFVFLAAKVGRDEGPLPMDTVIKAAWSCMHPSSNAIKSWDQQYKNMRKDITENELNILEASDFEQEFTHPNLFLAKVFRRCKETACEKLIQAAYGFANDSLHKTTFCLEYSPVLIAALSIYLACESTKVKIPTSNDGKFYWKCMEINIDINELDKLKKKYHEIINAIPVMKKETTQYNERVRALRAIVRNPPPKTPQQFRPQHSAQQRKVNSRQQNSKNPIRGNVNFVAGNKRPPSSQLNYPQPKKKTIFLQSVCNIDAPPRPNISSFSNEQSITLCQHQQK